MKLRRILALILALIIVGTCLAGCSKEQEVAEITKPVVEVADKDDGNTEQLEDEEDETFELVDADGNVLTVVPVYNSDGVTVFAGYIESAKDKNGKELDAKAYAYIKQVVAVDVDAENNFVIKLDEKNKPVTLTALCDKDGYIVAIQDTLDLDKDKDTEEYFKVVTKVDNAGKLFIKLDKDEKGALVNVTVTVKKDENSKEVTTVTTSDGKTETVKTSDKSSNLKEVADKDKADKDKNDKKKPDDKTDDKKKPDKDNSKPDSDNSGGNTDNGSTDSDKNSGGNTDNGNTDDKKKEFTSIVLKKNGQIACDADNVRLEGSAATGGMEVIVDGAGEYSKYYITSDTDLFRGQIEFRLSIGDDVEVKFNDVNISVAKKTAIKFTDVDKENNKENDTEESGTGTGNFGSGTEAAAPEVELSFTGTNSFKATGSGKNGTIYSECKLLIKGHGSADIDGGDNLSGICSTESVTIKNSTLNIVSKAKQGISCDRKVTVKEGAKIDIKSSGDGIHCNKFVYEGDSASVINIESIYTTNCADGIDANDWILIECGKLNVIAPTDGKYALKVRKVIKENQNGVFTINGGEVFASGSQNCKPKVCGQSTVYATTDKAGQITVDKYSSDKHTKSFICSPSTAEKATFGGTSNKITWKGKLGTVDFVSEQK